MLQIIKNNLKEGKVSEYISIAQKFALELSKLDEVNFCKVYLEDDTVFIVTDWYSYNAEAESDLFLKYKPGMKPLFVSNESLQLIEVDNLHI